MKKIIVLMLLIIMLTVTGCSNESIEPMGAYTTVIDKLYNEDIGLNSDIKYIAVDTSLIKNLSDNVIAI